MKTLYKRYSAILMALVFAVGCAGSASAQLYEIANRIPSLISPALSGSLNYKGFVEAGYSKTLGHYDSDFIEISTSQGFRYSNWFYMGVGIGADILFSHKNNDWGNGWENARGFNTQHSSTTTAVMLPLFTDFRFNIGNDTASSFFIDIKVGCSFLLSDRYISIGNGYLTNQEYFYLRPTIGIRIPTNSNNHKQAVDIGINYKLLTSNYWNSWSRRITLNGLGVSLAYEW